MAVCALGCMKDETRLPSTSGHSTQKSSTTGSTIGLINSHKQELISDLHLVAKSLIKLAENPAVTKLVAEHATVNHYTVKLSDLIGLCQADGLNPMALMEQSLDFCQVSNAEKLRLAQVLQGVPVGPYTFEPRIVFTSLKQVKYDWNGWNGHSPCGIAISLFHLPSNKIPVYTIENNSVALNQNNVYDQQVRPTWHVSYDHDVSILDNEGKVIDAIQKIFAQTVDCECCDTNDDPPSTFCEFDHPNPNGADCPDDTDPKSGQCSGDCTVTGTGPIILQACVLRNN